MERPKKIVTIVTKAAFIPCSNRLGGGDGSKAASSTIASAVTIATTTTITITSSRPKRFAQRVEPLGAQASAD
jgi:hypothetical protein